MVLAVVAVVALFLGIALATGFLTPRTSGSGTSAPAATATTVIKGEAASVTFDTSGGWVADDSAGTVRRFDPSSGAWLAKAVEVGNRPVSVANGYGREWVATALGNSVVAVNPTTDKVSATPVGVAEDPVSVATGEGGVWVASLGAGTVSLINPKTGDVRASVALPDGAVRVAVGQGAVWVTGRTDTLTRIDPKPEGVTLEWTSVVVGKGPIGVAVGDGAVWAANAQSGTVSKIDPTTLKVTRTFSTAAAGQASDPVAVAVWQGLVWVGDGESPTVTAFDPSTGERVGGDVTMPGVVRQLVVGDGNLWGATANPGRVVRLSR